jgi:hypothetical protein
MIVMASLSVRKLDKTAYDQLHVRAAKHGVSMEEETPRVYIKLFLRLKKSVKCFRNILAPAMALI